MADIVSRVNRLYIESDEDLAERDAKGASRG